MTGLGTTDPAAVLALAYGAARSGQPPSADVAAAARELAPALATLPPEIVRTALESLLIEPNLHVGLQALHDCGALNVVLPELDATVGFSQEGGRRHKDVWEHTKGVALQVPPQPVLRWSAVFHDIGKVKTRRFHPDGSVTFRRHELVGARQFDGIKKRLAFPDDVAARIRFLVLMHLRANAYHADWTDAAVRRFDKEMGEHLDDLLLLSAADVTSARAGRKDQVAQNLMRLRERVLAIRELDAKVPPLPAGLGNAIMDAFGLPPSRRVGELRALCEQAVEEGKLEERRDAGYYVDYLRGLGAQDPGFEPAAASAGRPGPA